MIGCERCHKRGVPLSVVELRSNVDGSIREWEICEDCFTLFLILMDKWIHTNTMALNTNATELTLANRP